MFIGTLGASLLWNLLIGKGKIRAGKGATATSQGQGVRLELVRILNAASSFSKF